MVFVAAERCDKSIPHDQYVIIRRGQLLCRIKEHWAPIAADAFSFPSPLHEHYLGVLDGQHCFAVFYNHDKDFNVPDGYEWVSLRSQLGKVAPELFNLAGRALQITKWYRDHQYCGVCGNPTTESTSDRACICTECDARFYPRISPCVIGLVKRGDQCLLGRGARHPEGMFSTLAGFIEPGESAEEAFAREVKEEVGVNIENIQYFSSQPWPFPGQLMIAYTADYAGGEIVVDGVEILEANWFDIDTLPYTPPETTISGKLIAHFVAQVEGRK